MTDAADQTETRRRRLLWRASHRGMKEMDVVLGDFARRRIAGLDAAGLDAFERLIEQADQDLLDWISGRAEVPAGLRSRLMDELMASRFTPASYGRLG